MSKNIYTLKLNKRTIEAVADFCHLASSVLDSTGNISTEETEDLANIALAIYDAKNEHGEVTEDETNLYNSIKEIMELKAIVKDKNL